MASARTRRHLAGIALTAAAIAGAVFLWDQSLKQDLFAKRFDVVTPERIYRSGRLSPSALRRLVEHHGIRTEIDFGAWEPGSDDARRARRTAEALDVDRLVLPLFGDATGDPNRYVEALRVMTDPSRAPVLVHCAAGTERTGAAIVFYRHIIEGVPLEEALREAEAAGHDPERNPRLRPYVHTWARAIERAYHTGRPIPWPPPDASERTPSSASASPASNGQG